MYRPKNWDDLWKNYKLDSWQGHRDIFEAGADAYGEWLTSQEYQDWLATPEGEACNGRWVFIPDEEKEDV